MKHRLLSRLAGPIIVGCVYVRKISPFMTAGSGLPDEKCYRWLRGVPSGAVRKRSSGGVSTAYVGKKMSQLSFEYLPFRVLVAMVNNKSTEVERMYVSKFLNTL